MASSSDKALKPKSGLFADRFEILSFLGTGLVGEVYRARDTHNANDEDGGVALKLLRPGQDPRLIRNEALTLKALWQEEEKLSDGLHVAPRLIDAEPDAPLPFLAMEFIRGKQIPDLMQEGQQRHFEEPMALTVAAQLFRTLGIIHGKLNKTYIDLKMENLWWQEEKGDCLKVTDWNVLEERLAVHPGKTDPVSVDIFRGSVALYWMLTGKLPDMQSNLKVRGLQRAANWCELSDATKTLLHGLFSRKFETAVQIERELTRLLRYWKADVTPLISEARDTVSHDINKSREIVSILQKRNAQTDKDFVGLEKDLNDIWSQRNDPSKSIALFNAGSYSAALALVEDAYPLTSQPHLFNWWRQAIELTSKLEYSIRKARPDSNLDEKLEHIRETIVKTVKAYSSQQYADAEQYFSKFPFDLLDVNENRRIHEDMLDALKIQRLYSQAESKREQISDEVTKSQRGLYASIVEDYDQARRLALTVPPTYLPEIISPAILEEEANDLQNEKKVLSKATKGNQHFSQGHVDLALETWREGFGLDPDHPMLMDIVLSATSESISNGALDDASSLLDIIPMSDYSFTCLSLRKKINHLKQKQSNLKGLLLPSEEKLEEQTSRDVEVNQAINDAIVTRNAKHHDHPRDQVIISKSGASNIRINKLHSKKRHIMDKNGTSVSGITGEPKNNDKSSSKYPDKHHFPQFIHTTPSPTFLDRQKKLLDIANKIVQDKQGRILTIKRLETYITEIKRILPEDKNDFPEERRRLAENEDRLMKARKSFKETQLQPLDARKKAVEELRALGFVGNGGDGKFEEELGLNILAEVEKAANTLSIYGLQSLVDMQKHYQNDQRYAHYINSRMEYFKKQVVGKTLQDDTFRDPKLLVALKKLWPADLDVAQAYEKLKNQALREKPRGWSIEYFRKLARLNPMQCKIDIDKYRQAPFVILGFTQDLQEIDDEMEALFRNGSLVQALSSAFSLGDISSYRDKMKWIIDHYKLDWQLEDLVNEYWKLKNPEG
jgi:serine/threonine protein kinase